MHASSHPRSSFARASRPGCWEIWSWWADKPDSVGGRGRRMIISLGRRSPAASSDLPEGETGRASPRGFGGRPPRPAPLLFGLAPGGVCRAEPVTRPAGELLPRRFTLTARRLGREAVCFLWHCPYPCPGGGRYPPPRPAESGLSSPGPGRPVAGPNCIEAIIRPTMTSYIIASLSVAGNRQPPRPPGFRPPPSPSPAKFRRRKLPIYRRRDIMTTATP